jgi:hypothetical protein
MVSSFWSIVWDSGGATQWQVLNYGWDIGNEVEWPWEQEHADRQVVEGAGTDPLPLGLSRGSLTITVYKEHASQADAMDYILVHRYSMQARIGIRASLTVTPKSGAMTVTIPQAIIKSANGRMHVEPEAVARTAFTYTFLFPS